MFYYSLLLTSIFFELLVFGYSGPKNRTIKISNIHKDFELFQLFMHNFLCQNISIFILYILLTINTIWFGGIGTVWHRKINSIQIGSFSTFCSLGYFWARKYYHILNYVNSLCAEFFGIFSKIYFQTKCLKIRQERFWTISSLHT